VDDTRDDDRVRLRMRVHEVSRTAHLRRVLTPSAPLRATHLTGLLWRHSGALVTSGPDLLRLGAMFRLAGVSPHSAVFVPLRENVPEPGDLAESWGRESGLADLLVVRDDVPLRPAAWPGVRRRLRADTGTPQVMDAPAPREHPAPEGCGPRPDGLTVAEHADTVVMSGPAADLLRAGDELTACGRLATADPGVRDEPGPTALSQFRGPDLRMRPGQRRDTTWECDIVVAGGVAGL
jgi:hypothetical protein